MKYAKTLSENLSIFPQPIRNGCINYSKWKVWMKVQPGFISRHWKSLIMKDCKRCNRFMYPYFTKSIIPDDQKFSLGLINTDTFYKICKRLDKRFDVGAFEFYKHCIKSKKFRFTSSSLVTLIK